jgi:SAM-dependent methyltransferase
MSPDFPERLGILDIVEGHLLGHVLLSLIDLGINPQGAEAVSCEALSARTGVNADLLAPLLNYLAARTDLVEQKDNHYRFERLDASAVFSLRQYVGAYGPVAEATADLLRGEVTFREVFRPARQAEAFAGLSGPSVGVLPAVIAQLAPAVVLDLGCGPGRLLLSLVSDHGVPRGIGVDISPDMCAAAENAARTAGAQDLLTFQVDDAFEPKRLVVSSTGMVVVASSLINELFHRGSDRARKWLEDARDAFGGSLLVVSDYYGRLGHIEPPWPRRTALHDLVQHLSGQGVPPPDAASWAALYSEAGVALLHVIEAIDDTGFIHILRL